MAATPATAAAATETPTDKAGAAADPGVADEGSCAPPVEPPVLPPVLGPTVEPEPGAVTLKRPE